MENDAKCAALAEVWKGSLSDCKDAIALIIGTAVGDGISVQPLLIQMIKEELKKINTIFPHDMPIPDVAACKFFNDSNLIGALYVHLKAQEDKLDMNKVIEFMSLVQDRREGKYLRELFTK